MSKAHKKKKILPWIIGGIAFILIIVMAGGWFLFGTFLTAANTIEKLEEGLYSLEYRGDYGFDDFLARGGAATAGDLAAYLASYLSHGFYKGEGSLRAGAFGCSTICAADPAGNPLFGRNYDWAQSMALIVHTVPQNGYESISTSCLDFLGFDAGYRPDGSVMERLQTLGAIYVPLDGMNEKGLIVADLMAGDKEETHQQTEKPDLTGTTAIRLLLDRAANVEEAIALLAQYDMNSDIGAAHHFSIADAGGRSVVVEYIDGEMTVTDTKVVTNHYLSDCAKQGVGSAQSHLRYDALSAFDGPADADTVRALLESVAQKNYPQSDGSYEKTMWSIVYDPAAGRADFCFCEDFAHAYRLTLGEKKGFIQP